jgi:hypothetical protein
MWPQCGFSICNSTPPVGHFDKKIWVGPDRLPGWSVIFDEESAWAGVLQSGPIFQLNVAAWDYPGNWSAMSPSQLASMTGVLKRHSMALSVEVEGTRETMCSPYAATPGEVGRQSAIELFTRLFDPTETAGGSVEYLVLDGPISRTIQGGRPNACQFTLNRSIQELISFLSTIYSRYPTLSVVWLENIPNWAYRLGPGQSLLYSYNGPSLGYGNDLDFSQVFEQTLDQINQAKADSDAQGKPFNLLNEFRVDFPYNYATGQAIGSNQTPMWGTGKTYWLQIIQDLQQRSAARRMRFGLIFNSNVRRYPASYFGTNTPTSVQYDRAYRNDTFAYMYLMSNQTSIPDDLVFESWYESNKTISIPSLLVPETTPNTFMNIVLEAIMKLRP